VKKLLYRFMIKEFFVFSTQNLVNVTVKFIFFDAMISQYSIVIFWGYYLYQTDC
jgi:hypothetical protein